MSDGPFEAILVSPGLSIPLSEIELRFSRSSGPGGQNVNRRETRVELLFDVAHSPSLTAEQRERLLRQLWSHLDSQGVLHLAVSTHRSQIRNREEALARLGELLREGLRTPKERLATRPTHSSRVRQRENKRRMAGKKQMRRAVRPEDE